ncbi:MAG TPA: sensor histidine kinase [Candidatus Eisenbergiella merdavium]|uniref:Sensor histidine kinase n=1 Tax=Candidatus Eisenbergiella merdavium TaxID=2838551 RepID=A0A9D2NDN2_9FIRM|nr:sensor histidine kinase [Candidatus Eisenbergiella merdavium]
MSLFDPVFDLFRNLKLKTKLKLIYFFASAVAFFLLIFVLNAAIGRQLFEHERSSLGNALQQSISQLEIYINDTINLSNFIYNNDDMLSACNQAYGSDYFRMYTAYSNDILPDIYVYQCLIPEVTDIKIYSSCGLIPYMGAVDDLALLKDMPWFDSSPGISQQWVAFTEGGKERLAYMRRLPQNSVYPYENYLYLEADYSYLFSSMTSVTQDSYGLVITDAEHSLLYQHTSFPGGASPIDAGTLGGDYEGISSRLSGQYLFLSARIEPVGWNVYYYSPIQTIRETVTQTVLTTFFMIAVCFALLYFLTFFTVNSILSPLAQLTRVIEKISLENIGDHELLIIPGRRDEIGTLIQTFNAMLKRMRILIDEAYVQKLKAKEYHFNALRAQINPHFLYNTLSQISAKAIMSGQNDISRTVQLLALFYRTSLNNGNDITTIGNELDNIRAYLSIQLTLTDHSFQVKYELDKSLLSLPIPCLILQPLVENAIEHGLRDSRRPDKQIHILLIREEGQNVCSVKIRDNGVGIQENRIKELFSLETDHIGIRNVNERLKLFFGEDYGLTLTSLPECGTEVAVRIPLSACPPG